jgi:hypothetical protein
LFPDAEPGTFAIVEEEQTGSQLRKLSRFVEVSNIVIFLAYR